MSKPIARVLCLKCLVNLAKHVTLVAPCDELKSCDLCRDVAHAYASGSFPLTTQEVMKRYPRITAHVIAESLGYATPSCAARIVNDVRNREQNWCEWLYGCYQCNPLLAVQKAIRSRHHHKGYMASYPQALALVQGAIQTGDEPTFASWF